MISYREYLHREYNIIHAPLEPELDFYEAIKNGNITKVKKLCEESLDKKKGLGQLSDNSIRNIQYHFVISAAMIARTCINGGLQLSEAYNMSDYYIQLADKAKNIKAISNLHKDMCIAYAKRMKQLQKETICSKPIVKCLDYIYDHLNTRITVSDLCNVTNLSRAYLSRLFHKETGENIGKYILRKKIETAKSMLEYSNYSIAEITIALAFPSQSYFTKVFKDETGTTPKNYSKTINHSY